VRLTIIAEGKLRERGLREVADDYLARIRRRIRCDEVEVRNAGALLKALPAGARIVALDVRGRSLTSRDFAGLLAEWADSGDPHVAFLVGGASGLSSAVMGRAHERLSLSPLTLPHRLARIVLVEQIYRALTIQRGEPYARED
jgi:23S rRNA (pseudouridine1915-N3)-methyltransferase